MLHYICDDSTLKDEKDFRTHCLKLLTKLAQLTNPSVADPVPSEERLSKLLFLNQLPEEQVLAGYSGQYLLVGSRKFKFDGQKSVDDPRIEFSNLQYFDEKGNPCKLYSFPDADFNIILQESLLTSGFDIVLTAMAAELKEKEIETEAKKIYQKAWK